MIFFPHKLGNRVFPASVTIAALPETPGLWDFGGLFRYDGVRLCSISPSASVGLHLFAHFVRMFNKGTFFRWAFQVPEWSLRASGPGVVSMD